MDITFDAIECGVTACPECEEICHKWPSLIKWSLTTIVLRLKDIRYCSIVARGRLKTLAYHSLPKYLMQKYKNLETKFVPTSPGLPYSIVSLRFFSEFSNVLIIDFFSAKNIKNRIFSKLNPKWIFFVFISSKFPVWVL